MINYFILNLVCKLFVLWYVQVQELDNSQEVSLTEYCKEEFGKFWILLKKCQKLTFFVGISCIFGLKKVISGACNNCDSSAVFG